MAQTSFTRIYGQISLTQGVVTEIALSEDVASYAATKVEWFDESGNTVDVNQSFKVLQLVKQSPGRLRWSTETDPMNRVDLLGEIPAGRYEYDGAGFITETARFIKRIRLVALDADDTIGISAEV